MFVSCIEFFKFITSQVFLLYCILVIRKIFHETAQFNTVKSRFNESQFNMSRFKVRHLVTKMKFHIKKSRFSRKSRYKESKSADGGHSLN